MPNTGRILEGLVTTCDAAGRPHLAPMGPIVDSRFERLIFRPFQTSSTFKNLQRTGRGVLHVTDDVELLARTAVGQIGPDPEFLAAQHVEGWILADCCRWYEFRVESIDATQARSEIVARTVGSGRNRDFFGFNRAMHAVVEGAILATRIEFLPREQIAAEMKHLSVIVEKTGGDTERRAFVFLQQYLVQHQVPLESHGQADAAPTGLVAPEPGKTSESAPERPVS